MVVAGTAVNDATVPVNADTLGGRPANDYVTDEEVVYYSGDIAIDETVPLNADTLQGYKASDFATTDWVKGEIANAQLGGGSGEGEIDLSGFALKADVTAEIDNKISSIDYPVDSVNGKTGDVSLNAADIGARPDNWMPTAQDVGARPDDWMPTADDVGAFPTDELIPLASGGTNRDLSGITPYAIVRAASNGTALLSTPTANGAFYATAANGAAQFGTLPFEQGGTGATSRLGAAKALTNEAVSSPNYVVSLTNSWGKFGYTSLAQLMTALGAASATPSISSASNSYNYAHFAKIGKLVICTILPKVMTNTVQYETTITIPSGYRPSATKTFTYWSNTAKNAGDKAGKVSITANTGGALNFAATYGFSVGEVSVTLYWATS